MPSGRGAFTLVEVLSVVAVISILLALLAPAFNGINRGRNLATATWNIQGMLDQARAYAMANNTHVFIGFEEVNPNSTSTPLATGTGRVAVAVVASRNGENGYGADPASWNYASPTPGALLMAISPLRHFDNVHLAASALPNTAGNLIRPDVAAIFQMGSPSFSSYTTFDWPLGNPSGAVQYHFTQVLEFDPQGTPWYQSKDNADTLAPYFEIGLQETNGTAVASGSDVAIIQIDGITGATRLYQP